MRLHTSLRLGLGTNHVPGKSASLAMAWLVQSELVARLSTCLRFGFAQFGQPVFMSRMPAWLSLNSYRFSQSGW